MSGIDPAAVEAAAKAIHHAQWLTSSGHWAGVCAAECWETDSDGSREEYRSAARAGLAAAVPCLAEDVMALRTNVPSDGTETSAAYRRGFKAARFNAARVVRGQP